MSAWLAIARLATLFGGAAAAASLSENIARGARNRAQRRQLDRVKVLPGEAARHLEREIGGRVAIGLDNGEHVLVVMKPGNRPHPPSYVGYRVILPPASAAAAVRGLGQVVVGPIGRLR